jgi:hypothetical protein
MIGSDDDDDDDDDDDELNEAVFLLCDGTKMLLHMGEYMKL